MLALWGDNKILTVKYLYIAQFHKEDQDTLIKQSAIVIEESLSHKEEQSINKRLVETLVKWSNMTSQN